jgi:hypothetical protein
MCTGSTIGTSVTALSARLFIKNGTNPDTFNIGIWNNSNTNTAPTGAATYLPSPITPTTSIDYPIGTPLFIVVKYEISTNTASIWVNPSLDSTEPTANLVNLSGSTAAPAQIRSICIRQAGSTTSGTGNIEIDDVRISDNWSYVTTSTLGVNQNTKMGLIVYPNPVNNGLLNIQTTNNSVKDVVVYDLLGKQVLSTSTPNSVNVSSLKSGFYTMKITEEDNTGIMKIVIN